MNGRQDELLEKMKKTGIDTFLPVEQWNNTLNEKFSPSTFTSLVRRGQLESKLDWYNGRYRYWYKIK